MIIIITNIEELERLATKFNFKTIPTEFRENWKAPAQSYPEGTPFFLMDAFVDNVLYEFGFISEFSEILKKAAQKVRNDESVSMIAWLWYYNCYIALDWRNIWSWPCIENVFGEYDNIIPILVLLAGKDSMLDFYEKKKIPKEVRVANYRGIEGSFTQFKKNYKNPKAGIKALAWSVRHFTGKLFLVGRLQYEIKNFYNNILVYSNRKTNEVICIAGKDQVFRSDGQYNGTNNIKDEKNFWTSECSEADGIIQGFPISPESYAINKKLYLKKDEWDLILKKGDPILGVHIPGGRKLESNDVKESYLSIEPFFTEYFPEYNWKAIICNSWLLDTKLREFLNRDSNIVKFQDSFYLYPVYSPFDTGVFGFLYNVDVCEPHELPSDTSLQRRVRDFMIDGGRIKTGGGFLLRKDLNKPFGHYKENHLRDSESIGKKI